MIKKYDESLKLAKEEVAKRIANSTNTQTEQIDSESDAANEPPVIHSSPKEVFKMKSLNVGDFVRHTYEDGIDYEAEIIEIVTDVAVIRYIGYENEQTVNLTDCVESWGKRARKRQEKAAAQDKGKQTEAEQGQFKNNDHHSQFEKYRNSMSIPPPMPPMPPMLDLSEDSEHMSAMLMSWYMSGYYTGLYQGIKQAQSNQNSD